MEVITSFAGQVIRFVVSLQLWDILDILVIAFLIYRLLMLVHKTQFSNLFKGVLIIVVLMWLSAGRLRALNFLLGQVIDIGILALLILFQPEIRRMLERMGSSGTNILSFLSKPRVDAHTVQRAIDATVRACEEMSQSRTGVLIVFERSTSMDDVLRSGTRLDAELSVELMKNIFFINAPMHDGAMLVRQCRILGAGCMLPLSKNINLSRDLGMRHRAGIGISESSDAVVVLVSEETGAISVAVGGLLKRHLTADTLRQLLLNELMPRAEQAEEDKTQKKGKLIRWLLQKEETNDASEDR